MLYMYYVFVFDIMEMMQFRITAYLQIVFLIVAVEKGGELLSKGKYDLTVLYTCMLNIQNELFVFQEKVYI